MLTYVTAFVGMFLLDFVWVYYNKATVGNDIPVASLTAGMIFLLNSVVIIGYVDDRWAILPAAIGAVLGTMIAMKFHSKKKVISL